VHISINKNYTTIKRLIEQIANLTSKTHQYQKYRDRKLRSFLYTLSVQLQSSNRKRATVNPLSRMPKDSYLTFSLEGVYGFQKVALCATSDSNAEVELEVTTRRGKRGRKRERKRERQAQTLRKCRKSPRCERPEEENLVVTTIALNLDTRELLRVTSTTDHEEFHYKSQVGRSRSARGERNSLLSASPEIPDPARSRQSS